MEGLTQKNRNVWLKNENNRLGKVGRTDSKNGKDWLKKWKGLTLNMEDLSQNWEGPIPKQADPTRKKYLAAIIKNNKSQKPFPFSQVHFYDENLLLYNRIPPTTLSVSVLLCLFFWIRVFLHRHWRFTGKQGKGGKIFLSTTSTRSKTFRHSFATLLVRWSSRIFNCNASIYQTATQ